MAKVTGILNINGNLFQGKEREINTNDDLFKIVREFELTLASELGFNVMEYEEHVHRKFGANG